MLVSNKLDEFEDQLSTDFIFYLAHLLPLDYCYTDWLAIKRRSLEIIKSKKRFRKTNRKVLRTHYLKTDKFKKISEQRKFLMFLQFLDFAKTLEYSTEKFGIQIGSPVTYRLIKFKVDDFFLFQNPSRKSINYYQVSQLKDFLNNLKEFSIASVIEFWSDDEFQILTYIPMAKVYKDSRQQNCLIAEVYLAENLFS